MNLLIEGKNELRRFQAANWGAEMLPFFIINSCMSTYQGLPDNINMLGQNGFQFAIKRLPTMNYFAQSVSIPAISMNAIETPTPFAWIPRPGDRLTYEPLSVTFKVDEDLKNYFEIQKWLVGLGHPDSLDQTRKLSEDIRNSSVGKRPIGTSTTFVSDAVLSVLTSAKNLNVNIFFYDCFPISLTELAFTSTNTTIDYLEATAVFKYRKYALDE